MATIPTTPGFKSVVLQKRFAVAMAKSPVSFAQQMQKRSGEEWVLEAELPPLSEAQATAWVTWLLAQEGMFQTFSFDVSDYDASGSGDSSVTFRLAANDTGWSVNDAMVFGIKFKAFEAQ